MMDSPTWGWLASMIRPVWGSMPPQNDKGSVNLSSANPPAAVIDLPERGGHAFLGRSKDNPDPEVARGVVRPLRRVGHNDPYRLDR